MYNLALDSITEEFFVFDLQPPFTPLGIKFWKWLKCVFNQFFRRFVMPLIKLLPKIIVEIWWNDPELLTILLTPLGVEFKKKPFLVGHYYELWKYTQEFKFLASIFCLCVDVSVSQDKAFYRYRLIFLLNFCNQY